MTDKLQQAQALVSQNKFKKALPLLKKINQKASQQTYLSLELEGICLTKEKKYQMADLVLQKSLAKAENNEQKCNTLVNLKSAAFSLKDNAKSIHYLKKLLDIDASAKTAEYRLQLCQFCYIENDYQTIISYAPKLFSLTDYSALALLIVISAYAKQDDKEQALTLYQKLLPELDSLTNAQVINLLDSLTLLKANEKIEQILTLTKEKFGHQAWHKEKSQIKPTKKATSTNYSSQIPKSIKPTERILGDNAQTVNTIKKLVTQLESLGAKFHPDLRFVEEGGNLSIKAYNNVSKKLMSVPYSCMPLLNDYAISINENKISAQPVKSPKNPTAIPIMSTMIELYNQTNKVNYWQQCYPLLALQNYPELIESLFFNTQNTTKLKRFKALFDSSKIEELTIETFIGSREFYFKKDMLNKASIETKKAVENGLLGVIDFLNHKEGDNGYQENTTNCCLEIEGISDPDTNELFVQYNFIDPMLTYLIYGFVDTSASVLFSCINTISCQSGLEIIVEGTAAKSTKPLNKNVSHLEKYMPVTLKRSGNKITLNNFIIPASEDANTLPQVIAHVLKKCDLNNIYHNDDVLKNEVRHIEKQLITNNLVYWQGLLSLLHKTVKKETNFPQTPKADIQNLCQFSINHLEQYKKAANITLL